MTFRGTLAYMDARMPRLPHRAVMVPMILLGVVLPLAAGGAREDEGLLDSPAQAPPVATLYFDTDFSRAIIGFDEITSGGVAKDGIPSIDDPRFVAQDAADEWIADTEAVLVVSAGGESRIYPIQILMYHEIVNDVVGGVPLAVTYCPLCNSSVAFVRELDGEALEFGVSGFLRFSNLIMYDRSTESWWQQADGRALMGAYAGRRLPFHPVLTLPWRQAREDYPRAPVLSRDTGYSRPYGSNPYGGYDSAHRPFLYRGPEIPADYDAMARVLAVFVGEQTASFPYPELRRSGPAQRVVGGRPIVAWWQEGTASPLDSRSVAGGRDVGSANAFFAEVDGRRLEFYQDAEGRIVDRGTSSIWSVGGRAVSGPLEGRSLEPVPTAQHFWFSWTAFRPGD